MRRGDETKARIVEAAAAVFNRQGYGGASISDVMAATGLQKGGIYGHFASKEALACAAFEHAVACVRERTQEALAMQQHAADRLRAIVSAFETHATDPPVDGGCPLLNTAVDAEAGPAALRERVQEAFRAWQDMIRQIVARGVERGELRTEADGDEAATLIISMMEGAILMSRLHRTPKHVERAVRHLSRYIDRELAP